MIMKIGTVTVMFDKPSATNEEKLVVIADPSDNSAGVAFSPNWHVLVVEPNIIFILVSEKLMPIFVIIIIRMSEKNEF